MNMDLMYDETEPTSTRYVGFVGSYGRFDLAILQTNHFYGKKLVICLQTNRCAILDQSEAEHAPYIQEVFQLRSEEEAEELSNFLSHNI
ncbi:DUF3055 domain-containing protein [Fodinisporobacter ferrooxydans]|uniref:DUF3055 domain-containing protein n=1 Tax=Fodinisporobacter ferrooxydans TaxID=2901836 RepID=A0ABY4CFI7_9BACL|nr:DUF3055 domain-containing protein [Alicyclobacillaceae bacterium MYW30-H2]